MCAFNLMQRQVDSTETCDRVCIGRSGILWGNIASICLICRHQFDETTLTVISEPIGCQTNINFNSMVFTLYNSFAPKRQSLHWNDCFIIAFLSLTSKASKYQLCWHHWHHRTFQPLIQRRRQLLIITSILIPSDNKWMQWMFQNKYRSDNKMQRKLMHPRAVINFIHTGVSLKQQHKCLSIVCSGESYSMVSYRCGVCTLVQWI